jgi:four helix bundle protein
MGDFLRIEDLVVYRRLCELHIDVWRLTQTWPKEERFELTSQVNRSSNSSPAQLAEKHSDRHVRNKIEGVNRARGEALETVHHLFVSTMKRYTTGEQFAALRDRYHECVRMLNGMERTLEQRLAKDQRRFPDQDAFEPPPEP